MANNSRTLEIILQLKDKFSREAQGVEKQISSMDKTARKLGTALVAGFSVSAITNFSKKALEAASIAEETQNRFDAVFSHLSAQANVFAQELSLAVGRSATEIKDGLASFQSFAIGMGLSTQKAYEMATALQTAAIDFASFNNLSDGEAQQRFISAMSGSSEVLDRFGINIKASALDLELHAMGLQKTTATATESEKAMARFNIIMRTMGTQGAVGDAIKTADSYANRLRRLQSNLRTIREQIGQALVPTISVLTESLIQSTNVTAGNSDTINRWAKIIYRVTNVLIGLAKGVDLVIKIIVGFADTMIQASKVAFVFAKDLVTAFFDIRKNVTSIITALAKAMTGDFGGAADELKSRLTEAFDSSATALQNFAFQQEGWGGVIADSINGIKDSVSAAVDLVGFEPVANLAQKNAAVINDAMDNVQDSIDEAARSAKSDTKEIADELEKLEDKYYEFSNAAGEALYELEREHATNLSSIRDEIAKTKGEIDKLNEDFASQKQSDVDRVAGAVVATEEDIAKIQKELQQQVSAERRQELLAELEQKQRALEENAAFIEGIEGAVEEARRRRSLTDLEREIEDYNTRREMAQKEFGEKMGRLQEELKAAQAKERNEIMLYEIKKGLIEEFQRQAAENHAARQKEMFEATKETIQKEIQLYEQLAQVMAKVRGGDASGVSRVVGKATNAVSSINITVKDNKISDEIDVKNMADTVAQTLMKQLSSNMRLAL